MDDTSLMRELLCPKTCHPWNELFVPLQYYRLSFHQFRCVDCLFCNKMSWILRLRIGSCGQQSKRGSAKKPIKIGPLSVSSLSSAETTKIAFVLRGPLNKLSMTIFRSNFVKQKVSPAEMLSSYFSSVFFDTNVWLDADNNSFVHCLVQLL